VEGMLQCSPDSSELHHLAGVAYYGEKKNETALKHFQKVKPTSRFYRDAVVHIAFYYQEKGNIDQAINFIKNAILNSPENPEFIYYLGTFYEEKQAYAKAETTLKQAIEINPEEAKYYFRLGVVYDKWGKKEASMKLMETVIQIDPKHANALNYLGYTYADLGKNLDEAERLIKEALKYKPNDGYITDSLGWVYYKKGQYEEALAILKKAADLVPDDPTILEHLGDAYLKANDRKNALKSYQRSLQKNHKDKDAILQKIENLKDK